MSWLKKIFHKEGAPIRLTKPPFPSLLKDVFSDGGLFHWTGKVHLDSWTGYVDEDKLTPHSWSADDSESDGELSLTIKPLDVSAGSEPTGEQARAFRHFLDNEETIQNAVLQGIFEVYAEWRDSYLGKQISTDGGKTYHPDNDIPPENMPRMLNPEDLKQIIRPQGIYVLKDAKEGFAEIGFAFDCKWDGEHGLGVLTHKGKVIQVGDGSAAFEHV